MRADEAERGGCGAFGDVDDDARLDVGDEAEGENLIAQEVIVGVHIGGDDAHDVVDAASNRHAFNDFRPVADGVFEAFEVLAAGQLELDVGDNLEGEAELVVVENGDALGDNALFFHAFYPPPAWAGGEADLVGDLGDGEGGVMLNEIEDACVDRVQGT